MSFTCVSFRDGDADDVEWIESEPEVDRRRLSSASTISMNKDTRPYRRYQWEEDSVVSNHGLHDHFVLLEFGGV